MLFCISMKKRILISELDETSHRSSIALNRLVNLGPVTLSELEAIGISTYGQLEELGWEEVARKWVESYPERLNVMAFVAIIATLEGIPWTRVTESDKAKARRLVNELRNELGLPATKATPRRKKKT